MAVLKSIERILRMNLAGQRTSKLVFVVLVSSTLL